MYFILSAMYEHQRSNLITLHTIIKQHYSSHSVDIIITRRLHLFTMLMVLDEFNNVIRKSSFVMYLTVYEDVDDSDHEMLRWVQGVDMCNMLSSVKDLSIIY